MEKFKHMKLEWVVTLPKIKKQIQNSSTWKKPLYRITPEKWSVTVVNTIYHKSLFFICRENPRRSGILLFPNCPRFCRLLKTRNRRSSGMGRDKSGELGAFLFSRRVPDLCDGRRSFWTNENSNLYRRGLWRAVCFKINFFIGYKYLITFAEI